ncbi:lipase [Nocardioides sp. Root1257]|uniref:GDSL-type esterase/lipase family protein n=1 Tax=unclassified Nocardioides TaxID=2615069 RepID=UPI0006FB07BE|nr:MULTISPECIES: SGNH/GDSL hydrolase family protein [unclassified Nocardioides]KQW53002.1 lipase [Nocardioides sp. Root1257]KRC55690.1 lipase [Nocardioides sp. Root224]
MPLTPTPITPDLVRGAVELEATENGLLPHRLPTWARAQVPEPQLLMAESQPSGVRLALRTAATTIELDTLPTKRVYVGVPPLPDGVYDLLVDGRLTGQGSVPGGRAVVIDMARGTFEERPGEPGTLRFEGLSTEPKDVEIWLPHGETTVLVELRTDAPVEPLPDRGRPVWLHHGSSISAGSEAGSPTTTWPARAAGLGGVDLLNLGLGGSALLDPFVGRTMRDLPADLISVKMGINLVNADVMRLRAFTAGMHGFLDTIRDGHPTTPLLVVSPIWCAIHEDTPGPLLPVTGPDGGIRFAAYGDPAERIFGKLTLRVVRRELARIVAERSASDPHLHYLDGLALYGEADAAEHPLPDDLHPDAATHLLIGDRFADMILGSGRVFDVA